MVVALGMFFYLIWAVVGTIIGTVVRTVVVIFVRTVVGTVDSLMFGRITGESVCCYFSFL